MKIMLAFLSILFWVILAVDCILIINNMEEYRFYTKPLLVPVLYILMVVQTGTSSHKRSKLYVTIALFLCMAGDFLLLNAGNNTYFIMGLCCFLPAHIFYSLFFLRLKRLSFKRITTIIIVSLAILAYLGALLGYLWTRINEQHLGVPVLLYALVIGFMLLTALHTAVAGRIRKLALQNFIPGAVLFIISDTLLAIDKFAIFADKDFQSSAHLVFSIFIMLTYGAAQFCIVSGATRFIKKG